MVLAYLEVSQTKNKTEKETRKTFLSESNSSFSKKCAKITLSASCYICNRRRDMECIWCAPLLFERRMKDPI